MMFPTASPIREDGCLAAMLTEPGTNIMADQEAIESVVVTSPSSGPQDGPCEENAALSYDELLPYLWLAVAGSF